MRSITLTALLMFSFLAASAQYFSTKEHQRLRYADADGGSPQLQETVEVDRADNGQTVSVMSLTSGPLTYTYKARYDANTGESVITVFDSESMRKAVAGLVAKAATGAGMSLSDEIMKSVESQIKVNGEIDIVIDPAAKSGSPMRSSEIKIKTKDLNAKISLTGKYLGFETITVPAGTFDCVKVEYTMTSALPNEDLPKTVTAWFAEGIGEVRTVSKHLETGVTEEQVLTEIE